jgi:hypothetical protein
MPLRQGKPSEVPGTAWDKEAGGRLFCDGYAAREALGLPVRQAARNPLLQPPWQPLLCCWTFSSSAELWVSFWHRGVGTRPRTGNGPCRAAKRHRQDRFSEHRQGDAER